MRSNNARAIAGLFVLVFALLSAGSSVVTGERLPVRAYTTADGLAQNTVNRIVRDSRGFLWFCTDDGLSRYDGYTFTNYCVDQGLPSGQVTDLLETRAGEYWVGTLGGLCRFNPRGRPLTVGGRPPTSLNNNQPREVSGQQTTDDPMFVLTRPKDQSRTGTVNALLEDRTGGVWCGAGNGLYRLEQTNREWSLRVVEIGLPREVEKDMRVRALVEDRQVALRRSREGDSQVREALSLISGTSRELVDSMGDIVWAVNPGRDRLLDLIKRMRRFASDVFSARSIAFHLEAPSDEGGVRLGSETRREVLLIFKEAVSNIARHSECTEAAIALHAHSGSLVLTLSDNGKGFDTAQSSEGNGLESMRHRAERMGGRLEVDSHSGEGTTVTLKAPIK